MNSEKLQAKKDERILEGALALHKQDKFEEAEEAYRDALLHNPRHAAAWSNLGTVLRRLGQHEAAIACSRRAMQLAPDKPSYLMNYGNCLVDLDRKDDALRALSEVVERMPNDHNARVNYAIALRAFCLFEEALFHFDVACKMKPDDAMTRWDRALTLLHLGRYAEGWDAYEVRWKIDTSGKWQYPFPRWNGEDLSGKTILVHEEQGFGDMMLCSRYLPLIKARGARVIFECKEALHNLFKALPGVDEIIVPEQKGVKADYCVSVMSLPRLFRTDLHNVPPPALLRPADRMPAEAARLLGLAKNEFRVGIVWSGSVTFKGNRKRAVGAERFLPMAGIKGVQLYSLQKGPREADLAECGGQALIWELGPHLNDFAETAAVINELDLVIMTDSSVAHLTGSLGRPVWNLLNYCPYWLYLNDRADCAWYPSMRLFRQPEPGDWDSVFRKVAAELERAAAMKKAGIWPTVRGLLDKAA